MRFAPSNDSAPRPLPPQVAFHHVQVLVSVLKEILPRTNLRLLRLDEQVSNLRSCRGGANDDKDSTNDSTIASGHGVEVPSELPCHASTLQWLTIKVGSNWGKSSERETTSAKTKAAAATTIAMVRRPRIISIHKERSQTRDTRTRSPCACSYLTVIG